VPKNVQIRNLDDATYEKLRARAASSGLSLAAYLRRELEHLASLATMAEILEEADQWRAEGGGVSREAILEALHAGREEREKRLEEMYPGSSEPS
jgi:plasmid stability protein